MYEDKRTCYFPHLERNLCSRFVKAWAYSFFFALDGKRTFEYIDTKENEFVI